MNTLSERNQAYKRLRLDLQADFINRGIPLEAFEQAWRLYDEAYESGFEAGRKLGLKIERSNGKPAGAPPKPRVVTSPSEARKNAAEGRRAVSSGKRPALLGAIATVMGKEAMASKQVVKALKERGWLPKSKNPRQYISFMFSSNTPNVFERAGRGLYQVAHPPAKKSQVKDFSAESLWKYLPKLPLKTFTAQQLAEHLQCDARRLPSPLKKLSGDGRLVDKMVEGKITYRVKR